MAEGVRLDLNQTFKENIKRLETELERSYIKLLLKELNGHREKVATRMGVSVKTLYNRMKSLEID